MTSAACACVRASIAFGEGEDSTIKVTDIKSLTVPLVVLHLGQRIVGCRRGVIELYGLVGGFFHLGDALLKADAQLKSAADRIAIYDADVELRFWVDRALVSQYLPPKEHNYKATIEVIAPDLNVSPPRCVVLDLVRATADRVLISPKAEGQRKILLRSTAAPAPQGRTLTTEPLTLDITVTPAAAILGLDEKQLRLARDISATVGIPAILLALINFWISRKQHRPVPDK